MNHLVTHKLKKETLKAPGQGAFFGFLSTGADKLLFITVALLLMIFVAYPIICIFLRSFGIGAFGKAAEQGIGLMYYKEVRTSYFVNLKHSVEVAFWVSLFSTAIAVAVSLFISTKKGLAYGLCMMILLLTMVSPPFVSSLAYIQLYGKRGWITYRLLGILRDPYNKYGIIFMESISYVPLNALFLKGILDKMDKGCLLCARDLGARQAARLKDIILPLMRPGILAVVLLNFVRSLSDYGTPVIIGGRYSTLASEIYMQIVGYSNLEKASAMNIILFIPSIVAFLLYRWLMDRSDKLISGGVHGSNAAASLTGLGVKLPRCGFIGALSEVLSWMFILMMSMQYVAIIFSAFFKPSKGVCHFTIDYWNELMAYNKGTLKRSIIYALIVAFAGTLFAMIFAWYVQRRKMPGSRTLDFISTVPYMIPGSCFGIAYILAFNHQPIKLTGTAFIVIANMVFKQLPSTGKICSASLVQIPESLEKSARDLGADQVHVLADVILPQLGPAFLSSFSYNFSSAMTTAGAIIFLIDPGRKLAVFKLFDAVYKGEYGVASVIAVIIMVVVLLLEGLIYLILGRRDDHVSGVE